MKKIMISAAVLALMATGCQNDVLVEQSQPQEGQLFTLEVGRGFDSRTVLSDKATHWSEDDAIYVSNEEGDVYGTLEFVSYVGSDHSKATFKGFIKGGEPSELKHIVFPVPDKNGKIDMSARTAGKLNAPMIGTLNGGTVTSLKNVGGILAITAEDAIKKIIATDKGKNMTGGYYEFVNGRLIYTPVDVPAPVYRSENLLFVPVATQTEAQGNNPATSAVSVSVLDGNNQIISASTGSITVTEGQIMGDNDNEKEDIVMTVSEVKDLTELKTALAKGGYIKLTDNITDVSEIITITKNVILEGNEHILTSSASRAINIETTGTVTINNLNIVAKEARAINIINEPSTVNLNDVTATADNNAVMVASSAGAVKLTVENCNFTGLAVVNIAGAGTTADIIDTKITNVDATDIENYGAITLWTSAAGASVNVSGGVITVADDSRKAYVFPGDASVTGVDDIGYIVATIGIAGYETLNEAVEDVTEAGTIELMRDINVSEPVLVEKDFTINMNGKTLSLEQPISVSGTLNLSNGTISSEGEVIVLENDGQVNIDENVKLNSGNGKGRIKNQDGLGTISASALGKFIVYHEIEDGTFESFMSLNEDQAYKNINTLVLKRTFTVDNTVIVNKCTAHGVNPSSYFSSTGKEFGGHVKRIEFTEGSSLDVRNNVGDTNTGRTSIGFEDICILGDASIIGNENNESVIYFDRGTKITISEGKTLSLKNKLGLATGNNPADSEKGNALVTGKGTLKIVGNNVRINDKQNDPNAIILNVLNVVVEKDTN